MDGQAESLSQNVGKGAHLLRLRSLRAAHAQWESDDDFLDLVLADYAREVVEIMPLVLALQSFEALSGNSERVRNGDPDAAGTDIESKHSAGEASRNWQAAGAIVVVVVIDIVRRALSFLEGHSRDYRRRVSFAGRAAPPALLSGRRGE